MYASSASLHEGVKGGSVLKRIYTFICFYSTVEPVSRKWPFVSGRLNQNRCCVWGGLLIDLLC